MNKKDIVKKIAEKTDLSERTAGKLLTAFQEVVEEALGREEEVALAGFGKFFIKEYAAKNGVNPQTKERIVIPARKKAVFKFGNAFQENVLK